MSFPVIHAEGNIEDEFALGRRHVSTDDINGLAAGGVQQGT